MERKIIMDERADGGRFDDFDSDGKSLPFGSSLDEAREELMRRFSECLENDSWPLVVEFALDIRVERGNLLPRIRLLPSDPPDPPPATSVRIAVAHTRECFRRAALDDFHKDVRDRRPVFESLALLVRLDHECFVQVAAQYFAERLASPENDLPGADRLAYWVGYFDDVDPELLGEVVARTRALCRRAADRLRKLLLDAIEEPECLEELGLLAAQALRDRLEEA
jgi:hypothetical protein